MIANGHTPARGKKNQKSKLDSSQINDGDFEKIMNGRFEYPYSMLSFCFVDTVEYRYVIKVVLFPSKGNLFVHCPIFLLTKASGIQEFLENFYGDGKIEELKPEVIQKTSTTKNKYSRNFRKSRPSSAIDLTRIAI